MRRSAPLVPYRLLLALCYGIRTQAAPYDYTGSWIIKANALSITQSDLGIGIGGEYRIHETLSLQLEAGFAMTSHEESSVRSLHAFSLRPELRIYLPHRHRRDKARADMYTGIEFTLKRANTHFSEWEKEIDDQGNTYQRLYDYKTRNITLGPIFKFGVQMYIGAARRLVIDIGAGAGPTVNQVSFTGNQPLLKENRDIRRRDPFSMNKRAGIYAHTQLDLRIGYRF